MIYLYCASPNIWRSNLCKCQILTIWKIVNDKFHLKAFVLFSSYNDSMNEGEIRKRRRWLEVSVLSGRGREDTDSAAARRQKTRNTRRLNAVTNNKVVSFFTNLWQCHQKRNNYGLRSKTSKYLKRHYNMLCMTKPFQIGRHKTKFTGILVYTTKFKIV